jgi:molybdate transport system substrate-binding protein
MSSAPLKIISSMATRDVLAELASAYESKTGQSVAAEAAGGVDVAKRVRSGEAFDVVVLASDVIDKLIEEGRLVGKRVDVVKSGIAIAVRAGSARPDIGAEEAVKRAVSNAKSLSYSTGPSGVYLEKMFARWGILETIRSRIVVPPPGVPVASMVADGRAEIGFQQLSELLNKPGVDVIGALPDAIQSVTIFSGGVSATCARLEAARDLLEYMASPATAGAKQTYGLEAGN